MHVSPTALVAASILSLAIDHRQRVPSCQQVFSLPRNSIARARDAQSSWWSGDIDEHASSERWSSWQTSWALRQRAESRQRRRCAAQQRSRPDLFTASRGQQKPNFAVLVRGEVASVGLASA